tara:strand:- start:621 stop:800 length:180 start_codon:yes stop_codon:yes gene_type:complete
MVLISIQFRDTYLIVSTLTQRDGVSTLLHLEQVIQNSRYVTVTTSGSLIIELGERAEAH